MTKQNIFYHHIVPYLGEMKLDEITPKILSIGKIKS